MDVSETSDDLTDAKGIDYAHRRSIFAEVLDEHRVGKCLIVTGSFRGGTSLVCSLLDKNGALSVGKEKFNSFHDLRDGGTDAEFRERLRDVFATASDGLFSSKIMWPHRNSLSLALGYGASDAGRFAGCFPSARWINIVRRDKVGQAISFWKAKQTGRWHVYKSEGEPEVAYDFEGIRSAFIELSAHDMMWADFYDRAAVAPITIVYEDFQNEIEGHIRKLVAELGGHLPARDTVHVRSNLKKQRDENSLRLRERFIGDMYKTGF